MCSWRRFRGRSGRGQTFPPRALRSLHRAHHLMETGDHANAAVLLEEMARAARDRAITRHAPFLTIQAGRASLLDGQLEAGLNLLRSGLEQLREGEWAAALPYVGPLLVEELQALGHSEPAQALESWLAAALPEAPEVDFPRRAASLRGSGLPLVCPTCSGTVRPGDVAWQDEEQPECVYCGSPLRAED